MPHKTYVVLDTNVFVSAMLKRGSVPDLLVRSVLGGKASLVAAQGILSEYVGVLRRAKFGFTETEIDALLSRIARTATLIQPAAMDANMQHMTDKKDIIFYATAIASRAAGNTTWLVTGNLRHFPKEHFIISPRAMLDILEQGDA